MGIMRNVYKILVGKLKRKDHEEVKGARIILKCRLRKLTVKG
jgi:hypothetical protein